MINEELKKIDDREYTKFVVTFYFILFCILVIIGLFAYLVYKVVF